jgi:Domain of unknown function (DUF4383)
MRDRTPVQSVAALVGVVFVLVGVIGFIPGITTQYHDLSFAGHDSGAKLLGIFQVSILHNLVHLLFGLVRHRACEDGGRCAELPDRRRRPSIWRSGCSASSVAATGFPRTPPTTGRTSGSGSR